MIELRRGEVAEVILNNLYAQTQLQSAFGINIVALVENEPKILNLKQVLEAFIMHRREVVTRRSIFELRRARSRGHTLEGLVVALTNIDPVIQLIKTSESTPKAKERLVHQAWPSESVVIMLERAGPDAAKPEGLDRGFGLQNDGTYKLTEDQAQAILDMRLNSLTSMQQDRLLEEYVEIIKTIEELLNILGHPEKLMQVVRDELVTVGDDYGDERLTEISDSQEDLTMEDLIQEQDMVVTLSKGGYAKTQPIDTYRAQRRGGRGKMASSLKEEDYIERLMVANTHDTILCFTNLGKVFWLRVFQIPPAGRAARGRPLVNILPLDDEERITAMLPIDEYREDRYIFMATSNGTVKKTPLMEFSRKRSTGLIAIELELDNTLIGAAITDGTKDVMLCLLYTSPSPRD